MENNQKEPFDYFSENQTENEPQEEKRFDPLAAGDMPETRKMPSYEEMRDEAVEQYKQSRERNLIYLFIGIGGLLISFAAFYEMLFAANLLFLVALLTAFFCLKWCISCLRNFSQIKRTYRYRLQRAVEIMEKADVFMQVPAEDLERFDRFWK